MSHSFYYTYRYRIDVDKGQQSRSNPEAIPNKVYKGGKFKYNSERDFLRIHKLLMNGLVLDLGKYRSKAVEIVKGSKVEHIAPPYSNLKYLMNEIFQYLKDKSELTLIKSCVFYYEMEFIHPFMDGNGRMGRLWQTSILMSQYTLFEFLPFETLISKNQNDYYNALSISDKECKSTRCFDLDKIMLNLNCHSYFCYLERSEGSKGELRFRFPPAGRQASGDSLSGARRNLFYLRVENESKTYNEQK